MNNITANILKTLKYNKFYNKTTNRKYDIILLIELII